MKNLTLIEDGYKNIIKLYIHTAKNQYKIGKKGITVEKVAAKVNDLRFSYRILVVWESRAFLVKVYFYFFSHLNIYYIVH